MFHQKAVMTLGIFGNSLIQVLSSASLRSRLRETGYVKVGHLMKTSTIMYAVHMLALLLSVYTMLNLSWCLNTQISLHYKLSSWCYCFRLLQNSRTQVYKICSLICVFTSCLLVDYGWSRNKITWEQAVHLVGILGSNLWWSCEGLRAPIIRIAIQKRGSSDVTFIEVSVQIHPAVLAEAACRGLYIFHDDNKRTMKPKPFMG